MPGPRLESLKGVISESQRFDYRSGWPQLDSRYIELAEKAVHDKLKGIREGRIFALEKVNRSVRLLTRSQSERLSFRLSGRLLREVKMGAVSAKESKAAYGLFMDVASVSMLALSVRVLHCSRPVNDLLQLFGIVAQLETMV